MATYIKRGKKIRAEVRRKGHPSISKTFDLKSDAKLWAQEQERHLHVGGSVAASHQTFGWLLDDYLEQTDLGAHELAVLEWWREQLGNVTVTDLRKKHFMAVRRKLQKEIAQTGPNAGRPLEPATVNNRMMAVSAVFTYGLNAHDDILVRHPVREIPRLKVDNERDPWRDADWSEDAHKRLLAACDAHYEPAIAVLVRVALTAGARSGELLALRWRDIDFTTGTGTLYDTKNGDNRVIPLGGVIDLLREWKTKRARGATADAKENDIVFYNSRSGMPYYYRQHWIQVRTAAGLEKLHFHDLRHVCASTWVRAGHDSLLVGQALGHRSAQMVKRYAHHSKTSVAALGVIAV